MSREPEAARNPFDTQPPPTDRPVGRDIFETAHTIALLLRLSVRAVASVGYAFTRNQFSRRFFLHPANFAGILFIVWMAANTPPLASHEPLVLLAFTFFGLCIWRSATGRPTAGPLDTGARYTGRPYLCRLGVPEGAAKMVFDPLLIFSLGVLATSHHETFGNTLLVIAAAMLLDQVAHETKARMRQEAIAKAERQAAAMASAYRTLANEPGGQR